MSRVFVLIAGIFLAAASNGWPGNEGNLPFEVGEKLTYRIYWGPLVAGQATLEVAGLEAVEGHECYHLVARAQTTGLVDLLFHVDSTTESWLDVKELCTRRYRQNRVEGKHIRRSETRYDYAQSRFTITNHLNGVERTLPLQQPLQDIVSALYYARTQPLQLNQPRTFLVNAGDTNRLVRLLPDQRKTIWTNPLGEVPALRVEPNPTLTIVAANGGRMWVWISDDDRRLPLVLISKMKIGSARFQLTEAQLASPAPPQRQRLVFKD